MGSPTERGAPITWPQGMYALASIPGSGRYGERLAVCAAHQGQHVVHGRAGDEWCQQLPPHRRGPRLSRLRQSTEPPPQRVVVDLDYDALGEALGNAVALAVRHLRADGGEQVARTDRRQGDRVTSAEARPADWAPTPLPTIQVWRPDDDDDA